MATHPFVLPLNWLALVVPYRGASFWRDVTAVLEQRGYCPPHRASRAAVLSAIEAVQIRSGASEEERTDGMAALFG